MSYCETCSTEYKDCKKYCKICGSELIAIRHDNQILSSSTPDNQKLDYTREHVTGNTLHFAVTDKEKVADDIADGSREPLIDHSIPQMAVLNETVLPLDSSIITDTDCVCISVSKDPQHERQYSREFHQPEKNLKEKPPLSDTHNISEGESSQADCSSCSENTLTSNPDSSPTAKTKTHIPAFESLYNVITEKAHRVSSLKQPIFAILSILFIGAGYWAYGQYAPVNTLPQNTKGPTAIREQQVVTIQPRLPNEVFDTIKQANLTKNISLFMSCYSPKFESLDSKKKSTLTYWNKYDYNDLNYNIKELIIHNNKASGIIEWVFSAQSKDTKKIISKNILYNVVLEKEKDGIWKIIFLKNI